MLRRYSLHRIISIFCFSIALFAFTLLCIISNESSRFGEYKTSLLVIGSFLFLTTIYCLYQYWRGIDSSKYVSYNFIAIYILGFVITGIEQRFDYFDEDVMYGLIPMSTLLLIVLIFVKNEKVLLSMKKRKHRDSVIEVIDDEIIE